MALVMDSLNANKPATPNPKKERCLPHSCIITRIWRWS